jgi:hypothetical protein
VIVFNSIFILLFLVTDVELYHEIVCAPYGMYKPYFALLVCFVISQNTRSVVLPLMNCCL